MSSPIFKTPYVSVADYFYKNYLPQSLFIAQKFADTNSFLILQDWTKNHKIHRYDHQWSVIEGNKVNYKTVPLYPVDYLSINFDEFFVESRNNILHQLKLCDKEQKPFNVNWMNPENILHKTDVSLYCT